MSNIDIVKILLKYIGSDLDQDKAIAAGCITILDHEVFHDFPQEKEPVPATPNPTAGTEPAPKKSKKIDTGKIRALREGGWSVAKIADEMGLSDQTVRNYMKKEGIA